MKAVLTIFLVLTIGVTEVVLPLLPHHEISTLIDLSSEGESESENETEKEKDKTPNSEVESSFHGFVLSLQGHHTGPGSECDDLSYREVHGPPPDYLS